MQDAVTPPKLATPDEPEKPDTPDGPHAPDEPDAPDAEEVAPRRGGRTARDMTISMVVLLVPLAIIVGLFRLRGGEDAVVVDPSAAISQAQAAGAFPVSEPKGLSADWKPLSARFQKDGSALLRVGYLTPGGGQVQLIESNEDAATLLGRELGAGTTLTGTVQVKGATWQSYAVRGDETALVLSEPTRTVVVIGHADLAQLTELATAVS